MLNKLLLTLLTCVRAIGLSLALASASLAFAPLRAGADPLAYVANTSAHVVSIVDTTTDAVLDSISVGSFPTQVAVSPSGSRAYVTNTDSDSVSVIDTAARAVVATVSVAPGPSAVAVTPGGDAVYVICSGGVLQVIDTALVGAVADPVVATLSFGEPGLFQGETSVAILPDGSRAYAVVSGALRVIDTATLGVLGSIPVGMSPAEVVLSPDGARAYVTNAFGLGPELGLDGQVVVVDTAASSVVSTIPLVTLPGSIAVTPDGSRAYVASVTRFWNTGYGMGFLPDRQVAVLDLASHAIERWIAVPDTPAGVAVTPDGSRVYVAVPDADAVVAIDTATDTLATATAVPEGPTGLAIASAPRRVSGANFVASDLDGDSIADEQDNCTRVSNPGQLDTDGDGYGNACDADYDGDAVVGIRDYLALARAWGSRSGEPGFDRDVECDGDGVIGPAEILLFGRSFGKAPGPSGLVCEGACQ